MTITKVREMRCPAKGVLSLILPSDHGIILTFSPEVIVTKGRRKIDSIKRDKSYWDQYPLLIERYRSQADLVWGSNLDLVRIFVREADRHRPLGVEVEGVVVDEVVYHHEATYTCEIDVHFPLYTYNDNIIVMVESMVGQSLILRGLQIRT
ncbi:hypothetical protein M9H77_14533 [Catharanthus roseus]|uniref:Uncharacterized protein n=1 Tax=Catharanthus roseus TaxID=4058 RepID=A0ACC0BNK7_CATRO|nr:hypothetical protein M9H77_14533 [Catharanthus roseus]